jgi:hypothetical protein
MKGVGKQQVVSGMGQKNRWTGSSKIARNGLSGYERRGERQEINVPKGGLK